MTPMKSPQKETACRCACAFNVHEASLFGRAKSTKHKHGLDPHPLIVKKISPSQAGEVPDEKEIQRKQTNMQSPHRRDTTRETRRLSKGWGVSECVSK
mmetsp:Transcript_3876/g.8850  ORF Transcript_3876/g.8850 Transcript_3876/m.8850 type:complete len:98 (+) Transcript_3876:12-305(+)